MNSDSIVACTTPYSVVLSVTAPDMQMVVVPAMSTSATTDIAKVSFTVLPPGDSTETANSVRRPDQGIRVLCDA